VGGPQKLPKLPKSTKQLIKLPVLITLLTLTQLLPIIKLHLIIKQHLTIKRRRITKLLLITNPLLTNNLLLTINLNRSMATHLSSIIPNNTIPSQLTTKAMPNSIKCVSSNISRTSKSF
jgi:hypothetical protein